MVIAQASANREPRWLLTLRGATSLDDDLGMLGTWVGPRTGPDRKTHGQKEDYVARRVLVAWRERGCLKFPVEVHAETEREGEPDFVLTRSDADSLGIEVTEAGEEIYQKWLTFTERREVTDSIPLEVSTPRTADNLILHLLKWEFQQDRRGQGWRASIDNARAENYELLTEMPSLRRDVESQIAPRYARIRKSAALQTGVPLDRFPERCPCTAEQLMDPEFLPQGEDRDGE